MADSSLSPFMAHTIFNNHSSGFVSVGYYDADGRGLIEPLASGGLISFPVPVFQTRYSPLQFPLTVRYEITEHGDAVQITFSD